MNYKYPDSTIIVLCKAPIAGDVKTRLMPQLSAQQAVSVQITLTHALLSLLSKAQLAPIQLWCSPDSQHPFFNECAQHYSLSLHVQEGGDLGERMYHAISSALQTSTKALLVGCDCPSLTVDDFEHVIQTLYNDDDVIFSPAEDGGYVLIALQTSQPHLFMNMTWGNQHVLNESIERAKQAGLNIIKTRQHWDVDTFSDFERYQRTLLGR